MHCISLELTNQDVIRSNHVTSKEQSYHIKRPQMHPNPNRCYEWMMHWGIEILLLCFCLVDKVALAVLEACADFMPPIVIIENVRNKKPDTALWNLSRSNTWANHIHSWSQTWNTGRLSAITSESSSFSPSLFQEFVASLLRIALIIRHPFSLIRVRGLFAVLVSVSKSTKTWNPWPSNICRRRLQMSFCRKRLRKGAPET